MPRTRVKICCIATPEEARMAIDAGASALGLVSRMPSGRRTRIAITSASGLPSRRSTIRPRIWKPRFE